MGEIAGDAEQDRRVPVVAAAVEYAGGGGGVGKSAFLRDRQCIHVRAQADRRHGASRTVENTDDACRADPCVDLDVPRPQQIGDDPRCALLLEPELRMGVDVTPDRDQIRYETIDQCTGVHDAVGSLGWTEATALWT